MKDMTLVDDFGRRHKFTGEMLVEDHTDTVDGRKPQWVEIELWRTEGGSYVVRTATCYRIRHSDPSCAKAEGYDLEDAKQEDTYPCNVCNKEGFSGGYGQLPRTMVEAYRTPAELIDSFKQNGQHTNFGRSLLADLSEKDEAVDAAWNTVVIP